MRERRFGSFEQALRISDTIDSNKIEARFRKGVLRLTLLNTVDAQKPFKTIEVRGE